MLRIIAAAGLAFLAAANAPTEASTISGSYTGHITNLNFGGTVAGAPDIKLNDPFEVDYSYETTAGVYSTFTSSAGSAGADYYGTTFSLTLGTFHVAIVQPLVEIEDFPDSSTFADHFGVWGSNFFGPAANNIPGWDVDAMFLTLYVPSTTLSGTGLPISVLDPANDYPIDEFQLTLKQSGTGTTYYIFGSLRPPLAATPIPASVGLFLSALGCLGLFGWHWRKSDQVAADR